MPFDLRPESHSSKAASAQAVRQRKKPARKSPSAATVGLACAHRVCCELISHSLPDSFFAEWERCRQNHLDTPKGPYIGAINRPTTGHIPKPLPRARRPTWRRRLHRRRQHHLSPHPLRNPQLPRRPSQMHGPYWQWTAKIDGKTFTPWSRATPSSPAKESAHVPDTGSAKHSFPYLEDDT
jgi:hypothetical protein